MRALLELPTPILSLYLGRRLAVGDDPPARRHAVIALLAALAASEKQVKIVEDVLDGITPGRAAGALFVGADGSHHDLDLPGSDIADLVLRADVPHLTPLLDWQQAHPAYVVVLLDRVGADITIHPEHGGTPVTVTVTAPEDQAGREDPGGWSQHRYHQRPDESWQPVVRRAVEETVGALDRAGAAILLLGGDARAVQYFTASLPVRVSHAVSVARIGGSRHADGAWPGQGRRIAEKLASAVAGRTAELLSELASLGGPGGRGLDRPSAVIAALGQGRVRTLLVADVPDRDRIAWFGTAPTDIAVHRTELPVRERPPCRGPLIDVAVRAAILTDAEVRILPAGTPGAPVSGIAAICRF